MGKSIYEAFETDKDVENAGQWFKFGPGPSGKEQRFLLARMSRSNKKYTAAVQRMHDEYGTQVDAGTLADETATVVLLHIFCTTVLLGWDGIAGRDGNDIEFSYENAEAVMTDLPDLHANLEALAKDREHFLQKQNVADSGN